MASVTSYETLHEEFMANPEVKASYDAMKNEFALAHALNSARAKAKLSQKDVAERMNTTSPAIAPMEGGRQTLTIASLAEYATAVGQTITINIHPVPRPEAAEG